MCVSKGTCRLEYFQCSILLLISCLFSYPHACWYVVDTSTFPAFPFFLKSIILRLCTLRFCIVDNWHDPVWAWNHVLCLKTMSKLLLNDSPQPYSVLFPTSHTPGSMRSRSCCPPKVCPPPPSCIITKTHADIGKDTWLKDGMEIARLALHCLFFWK